MKFIFIIQIFFLSLSSFADEKSIHGTLFKKNGAWNIFIESEYASFKKGTLRLIQMPKIYKKILIEKTDVEVIGHPEKCDTKQICFVVQKIMPTSYDPLKKSK